MRARFVCQVNWYITRFKFYVQEQFLIWCFLFSFCSLKFKFATLLLALDVCHVSFRMKYVEWNPIDSQSIQKKLVIFCTISRYIFLVHFKAYAILMLIWSITRRMSARFESILQVSTSPLFMFNWLGGVKCRIFQLQCIFNNRANPSHRVLSIDLQFVKSDNIFVLFVARLHFSINQMMCWF